MNSFSGRVASGVKYPLVIVVIFVTISVIAGQSVCEDWRHGGEFSMISLNYRVFRKRKLNSNQKPKINYSIENGIIPSEKSHGKEKSTWRIQDKLEFLKKSKSIETSSY